MMNAKSFNRMDAYELDNVVGGTVGELNGLVAACAKNPFLKMTSVSTHMPGANFAIAKLVGNVLDKMGIDANIDLGFGGTGIGSRHNTYIERSTGEHLSQIEVEKRLAEYAI